MNSTFINHVRVSEHLAALLGSTLCKFTLIHRGWNACKTTSDKAALVLVLIKNVSIYICLCLTVPVGVIFQSHKQSIVMLCSFMKILLIVLLTQ